ncbi:MAG: hypothetical protein N838_06930 [Thiohalocapsa sp. PB-PSB1]|nr:MAG: hypothetical protein N838_06930 [Thiohalocapsa sp. PB-PSB1]
MNWLSLGDPAGSREWPATAISTQHQRQRPQPIYRKGPIESIKSRCIANK